MLPCCPAWAFVSCSPFVFAMVRPTKTACFSANPSIAFQSRRHRRHIPSFQLATPPWLPGNPRNWNPLVAVASFRIGYGFDLHRLEPGLPLVVGGVKLDHDRGSVGHSDGDVVYHSVVDAILGGLGLPDIGQLFSDRDERWKGVASKVFMEEARKWMVERGYDIANLDITVVLEKPKLAAHKDAICQHICELLRVDRNQVNIKAKTHEKVDSLGQNLSIACHTVVLLQQKTDNGHPNSEKQQGETKNLFEPHNTDAIDKLYARVVEKSQSDPRSSWTSRLFSLGKPTIAKKLGEEAVETVIAGLENDSHQLVKESADLLYHLCVYWAYCKITPQAVYEELQRRESMSGLEEKASRPIT